MEVLGVGKLAAFTRKHVQAETRVLAWLREAEASEWRSPTEIIERYKRASVIRNGRIIFRLGGNRYRLVVDVSFRQQEVHVVWIGTHSEYDHRQF
jgi:mRNA interferase HigB